MTCTMALGHGLYHGSGSGLVSWLWFVVVVVGKNSVEFAPGPQNGCRQVASLHVAFLDLILAQHEDATTDGKGLVDGLRWLGAPQIHLPGYGGSTSQDGRGPSGHQSVRPAPGPDGGSTAHEDTDAAADAGGDEEADRSTAADRGPVDAAGTADARECVQGERGGGGRGATYGAMLLERLIWFAKSSTGSWRTSSSTSWPFTTSNLAYLGRGPKKSASGCTQPNDHTHFYDDHNHGHMYHDNHNPQDSNAVAYEETAADYDSAADDKDTAEREPTADDEAAEHDVTQATALHASPEGAKNLLAEQQALPPLKRHQRYFSASAAAPDVPASSAAARLARGRWQLSVGASRKRRLGGKPATGIPQVDNNVENIENVEKVAPALPALLASAAPLRTALVYSHIAEDARNRERIEAALLDGEKENQVCSHYLVAAKKITGAHNMFWAPGCVSGIADPTVVPAIEGVGGETASELLNWASSKLEGRECVYKVQLRNISFRARTTVAIWMTEFQKDGLVTAGKYTRPLIDNYRTRKTTCWCSPPLLPTLTKSPVAMPEPAGITKGNEEAISA
ncbi:hypothetical protein BDK51DRAFT_41390 [Blyttiomyces helicus]|uniref:Uncharacterized protein n=1 Tax=Blyttiomyces helicus TaxID=388810 RepID=A0A4P9WG84_9FUNG|nr:hypothetical protein BDK51DRAFT_41390 [Blyttiomyces helicus]|eukprot:RKO89466.1 hypothetical protein BDK51DRAFT_41390 [Blyttiomyces helicus]